MNRHLIASAVMAVGLLANGSASAAWNWTGTIGTWRSAPAIFDGVDTTFTFVGASNTVLDSTGVVIQEIEIGNNDFYDVGFIWGAGSAAPPLSAAGSIDYTVTLSDPDFRRLTSVEFDTLHSGSGVSATKSIDGGAVLLTSLEGGSAGASLSNLAAAQVSDSFPRVPMV